MLRGGSGRRPWTRMREATSLDLMATRLLYIYFRVRLPFRPPGRRERADADDYFLVLVDGRLRLLPRDFQPLPSSFFSFVFCWAIGLLVGRISGCDEPSYGWRTSPWGTCSGHSGDAESDCALADSFPSPRYSCLIGRVRREPLAECWRRSSSFLDA